MIAEMSKTTIAIPRSQREGLLQFLQEESVLHIIEHDEVLRDQVQESTDTSYHLAQLQLTLEFIARMKKELEIHASRSLKNLFARKPLASLVDLERVAIDVEIPSLIQTVQHINDELVSLDARMVEVRDSLRCLDPWASLLLYAQDADMLHTTLIHHLLIVSARDEREVLDALETIPTAIWQVVHRDSSKNRVTVYLEFVAHSNDAAFVEEVEQRLDATLVTLPVAQEESIAGKHAALVREEQMLMKKRVAVLAQARGIVARERDILFAYDAVLHREERERVSSAAWHSSYTVVISGWVPTTWAALFTKRLADVFPDAAVEMSSPEAQDKAPILFQNNSLVRPFEVVTDLYGKPAYHELDPTGPLALFFLISFALALTDAGYGVLIMIATLIAEKFFRLKRDMQKMTRLLFFGGAMTVVMGALTGGWFSINLDMLSDGVAKDVLLGVKLLDPLKQPMLFLGIIFGFGVVQLLYAWIVRGLYHWKRGEKNIAIMDDFSWVVLVITIILSIASSKGFLFESLALDLQWLMYAAFAFIVITQGRASKNIFLRIGVGLLSLNGLIAFVSDMLSYSRLLALGLATGIIGLVVNLIASMVHESIPVVGVVLAGVVLIVGHVFNLGINALGAFIHSGRLQFVEFFPKFLEGGGVAFRPFGRVGKHVDDPRDFSRV